MTEVDDDVEITDLVPYDPAPLPATLFGTGDPKLALARMGEIASALMDVIEQKKLFKTIRGRKHVYVEGWTTLGGMLGIAPVVISTRPNETGDGIIAHVEARRISDGAVVGAAEGECSRAEEKWKDRDPFAIRSMAQTRGISRALRAPLGQIVVLAGYEPAAAEEMPLDDAVEAEEAPPASAPADDSPGPLPPEVRPSPEQLAKVGELMGKLKELRPNEDWVTEARTFLGIPDARYMTRSMAESLIEHQQLMWELAASIAAEEADESRDAALAPDE